MAPLVTPKFAVPRKTPGDVRLVNDYRRLNEVTTPYPYYQPRVEDILQRMATAVHFSIFDLALEFYQVPVAIVA